MGTNIIISFSELVYKTLVHVHPVSVSQTVTGTSPQGVIVRKTNTLHI